MANYSARTSTTSTPAGPDVRRQMEQAEHPSGEGLSIRACMLLDSISQTYSASARTCLGEEMMSHRKTMPSFGARPAPGSLHCTRTCIVSAPVNRSTAHCSIASQPEPRP